ncbi:hypothetical protein KIW84_064382 [Lathyrus oleraceus]|uniref:Uncharacterized protein n=1 Tax=Pisum sativum TaxID=3888 RepID=A0A9D5A631_PEA|nr:hypothetical protein KIW84_064382 [Pisum sativum]
MKLYLRLIVSPSTALKLSHRTSIVLKLSHRPRRSNLFHYITVYDARICISIHGDRNSLNLSPNKENNFSLKVECFIAENMASSKNGYETEIWAFNYLSLGKAPAVSRFSFPRVLNWLVISLQKKNIEKAFEKNMIIDRVVATEEYLKYDIVNIALFEQGQQFVDVTDYQRLMADNKDFKEMIAGLEYEMRMMKEARVNTPFEDEVVQDDRHLVNFITEDEVETFAGDVRYNNPFNDDANVTENQSKSKSNMATRMRKKPRKHGKITRMNL